VRAAEADRFGDNAPVMLRGIESVEVRAVTLGSLMVCFMMFRGAMRASCRFHSDLTSLQCQAPIPGFSRREPPWTHFSDAR
jgi:hypothetical protein